MIDHAHARSHAHDDDDDDDDDDHHHHHRYCLRELFYCRNPGDARVKVGSDREAATSPALPSRVSSRSGFTIYSFARGDPPKLLLSAGSRVPKRSVSVQEQSGPGMQGSPLVRVQVVIVLAI